MPAWGKELDETDSAGRGWARRDAHLLHQGLLPRARSRSRGYTIAATSTGACACSMSRNAIPGRRDPGHDGKVVGRVTSAVPGVALGYVRVDVPDDAQLDVGAKTGFARLR